MLRLLCVAQDPRLMSGVRQTFPDVAMQIATISSPDLLKPPDDRDLWDVLVFDLEGVESDISGVEFIALRLLDNTREMITVVPTRYAAAESKLRDHGIIVLHSPASTGELVLALNRALRGREEKNGP